MYEPQYKYKIAYDTKSLNNLISEGWKPDSSPMILDNDVSENISQVEIYHRMKRELPPDPNGPGWFPIEKHSPAKSVDVFLIITIGEEYTLDSGYYDTDKFYLDKHPTYGSYVTHWRFKEDLPRGVLETNGYVSSKTGKFTPNDFTYVKTIIAQLHTLVNNLVQAETSYVTVPSDKGRAIRKEAFEKCRTFINNDIMAMLMKEKDVPWALLGRPYILTDLDEYPIRTGK